MSKYNARKTEVDGILFDSKKEARRYKELKLLEKAKEVENLKLQPRFVLMEGFRHEGKAIRKIEYIADFMYFDNMSNELVVEDTKGYKTDVYNVKKKLFLKRYGEQYKFIES